MNYIVLDMEWNQGYPGAGVFIGDSRKILAGEIIQIGAVKLDENFKLLDTYSKLIKPVFYRKMHFKVEQLTGINARLSQMLRLLSKDFRILSTGAARTMFFSSGAPTIFPFLNKILK